MKVLVVEDEFYARKAMIRQIKKYDQDMILISGPGHGGNFFVANTDIGGI